MEKQLYVCDLDGTLAEDGKKLSVNTVDMLNKAFEVKGKELVISSARNYLSIKNRIKGINKYIKTVCRNGSVIYNEQGEVIYMARMKKQEVLDAINYSLQQNLCPVVISVENNIEKFYCKEEYLNIEARERLKNVSVRYVKSFESEQIQNVIGIYSFGKISKDYTLDNVLIRKDKDFIQVTSKDATKGSALEYIKSMFEYDSVTCFGNDENDYSMLDLADNAYYIYENIQGKNKRYNNIPWDNAKSIIQIITKGGVENENINDT